MCFPSGKWVGGNENRLAGRLECRFQAVPIASIRHRGTETSWAATMRGNERPPRTWSRC
jgi:hypothetical protein